MTNRDQSRICACLPQVLACFSVCDTGITSSLYGWYCQQLVYNQICFHSQYVPSHHVNFHGPTTTRRSTVLFVPYSPGELCVTVALPYGKSSLKHSENSRSYKAKNTGWFFFVCHTKTTCRRISSQKNGFKCRCSHSVLFYLVTVIFLRKTVKRL